MSNVIKDLVNHHGFFNSGVEIEGFSFNNCQVTHAHTVYGYKSYYKVISVKEWTQGHEDEDINLLQCSKCSATIPRDFFVTCLRLHGSQECQKYIEGRI